jgi:hypothetical protein
MLEEEFIMSYLTAAEAWVHSYIHLASVRIILTVRFHDVKGHIFGRNAGGKVIFFWGQIVCLYDDHLPQNTQHSDQVTTRFSEHRLYTRPYTVNALFLKKRGMHCMHARTVLIVFEYRHLKSAAHLNHCSTWPPPLA